MIRGTTEFNLKYGNKRIKFYLDDKNVINILAANEKELLKEPLKKLDILLSKPINSLPLKQLIKEKKAQNILIIVNDCLLYTSRCV